MARLTPARLQEECDEVISAFTKLRADLPELLRRSQYAARDGYPASSLGGGGGRSAVARPTENVALAPALADPVRGYVKRLLGMLAEANRNASQLDGLRSVALEIGDGERGRINSVDVCENCGDPCLPRARAGRCWACYEYRRRTGHDRQAQPPRDGALKVISNHH